MIISSKNKVIIILCAILLTIYGGKRALDYTVFKDSFTQTEAVIVSKVCRKQNEKYKIDRRKCYIEYAYIFDYEQALEYRSESSLLRRLELHSKAKNFNPRDYHKYFPNDRNENIFAGQYVPDEVEFGQFNIGHKMTVEYREDAPWDSRIFK